MTKTFGKLKMDFFCVTVVVLYNYLIFMLGVPGSLLLPAQWFNCSAFGVYRYECRSLSVACVVNAGVLYVVLSPMYIVVKG